MPSQIESLEGHDIPVCAELAGESDSVTTANAIHGFLETDTGQCNRFISI